MDWHTNINVLNKNITSTCNVHIKQYCIVPNKRVWYCKNINSLTTQISRLNGLEQNSEV